MSMPAARPANTGLASARVRERMVERVREQGVTEPRVLDALRRVPRHAFVDPALASRAYEDTALPIGFGQTMSQPYVVARAAELALRCVPAPQEARVLEIGTGCGYAAAVLAQIFGLVISIERVRPLHELARRNLRPLRQANLRLVFGDGMAALKDEPLFDTVIAAAAAERLPPGWIEQTREGGAIVAPIGGAEQQLTLFVRGAGNRVDVKSVEPVRFVPLRAGTEG